ncbi:MAG: polysaccharide deacetylase family protein [Hyphomicrobiaceae bacterium]|nr:polysaccharide deacetylase family protein [Hyphomicrobiaceae bacterium]
MKSTALLAAAALGALVAAGAGGVALAQAPMVLVPQTTAPVPPKPVAAKPVAVAPAPVKTAVVVKPAAAPAKPVAAKPVVAKPIPAKPVAAKPVVAPKPVAPKPPPIQVEYPPMPPCPGNPDALGTARTIEIDTDEPVFVGMLYRKKLPLAPREVVLTFDDGPIPGNTDRTVAALDKECVKATFFIVGTMAKAYPDVLRRTAASGHNIGYHTNTHPLQMVKLPLPKAFDEIETGWRTVDEILFGQSSDKPALSFFRYPGLFNSTNINTFLTEKRMGAFAADATGNDWVKGYDGPKVLARALMEVEQQNGGILLLHDTKVSTSSITAELLRELKARGFKVVHMVPKRKLPVAMAPQMAAGTPVPLQQRAITPPPALSTLPQPMPGGVTPLPAALVKPQGAAQPQSAVQPAGMGAPGKGDALPASVSADVTGSVTLKGTSESAPQPAAREEGGWWKGVKGWFGY